MSPQITDAVSEWLHEAVLKGIGEAEAAEMERIFHALRDAGAPINLVGQFDRAAGAYATRLAEAAFVAGLELARDPVGFLVFGRPWPGGA